MHLVRLAFIQLSHTTVESWPRFTLESRGGPEVRVIDARQFDDGVRLLVEAALPLQELPVIDDQQLVEVPESPRETAELEIERVADLMSIATGEARSIFSPNPSVAFKPDTREEKEFLADAVGVKGADSGESISQLTVFVEEAALAQLADRQDGAALLAEALAHRHTAGRFRELIRVFEHGFKASSDRLVLLLADFLALRPGLGYTKQEVKNWIIHLRGPATHADKSDPLVGPDLRGVVDRMLLAAYEVVFNKERWRERDSARRQVWTPTTGPQDASGNWFVVVDRAEAPFVSQLIDPFGKYPLTFAEAANLELPESYWPRHGPESMTAPTGRLEIVPADRMAVLEAAPSTADAAGSPDSSG